MNKAVTPYHQHVAQEKRALIVAAATELFLELGYDRTSLARSAARAGVSRATLFKQFPTKAALFDAIVTESWSTAADEDPRQRATSSPGSASSAAVTPHCSVALG